ncbi:hypothetical protein L218DRAFT_1079334 [Marasmius fiardii PR-910]|nr:hypothetical protein L218DRAFT_1079334 [Marasmius fiardii PR-910]
MPTNSGNKRKTPERSSPRKSKNIYGSRHQSLSTARNELAQHYNKIPEKSIQEFSAQYLPSVDDHVVDDIMKKLQDHVGGGLTQEGKVWGYAKTGPNKKKKHEALAFEKLCSFLQLIIEYADKEEKRETTPLVAHGSKQTRLPGERANSSRPDSHLHLLKTAVAEVIIGWEQLLAVGEFKKALKNQNDNWAKVLWGMNHIMRNDPCRLFTFGYSVEDDQARLWYHARSCVLVSEKFNWVTEPRHFVKFVLALSLTDPKYFTGPALDTEGDTLTLIPEAPSTASNTASTNDTKDGMESLYREHPQYLRRIGIDPTMQRVIDSDGKIQYKFRVKGVAKGETCIKEHVFITEDVLCDWKADCGTGRATRVWIVYREGDSGPQKQKFVLKDVWLEVGAGLEGDKLDQLERDVEHLGLEEPKLKQWFKDHFLHKHVDQNIGQRVPGVLDGSSYISLPPSDPATAIHAKAIRSGSQRTVARGGPSGSPQVKKDSTPEFPDRFHYRVVFQDMMIPLEAVSNRLEASEVVMGILRACWVLWKCKRVHRDVSSWNALWDPKTKTGRLADYDYVTEYGKPGTGTIKTGTPHFWSIEVEAGEYLYLPGLQPRSEALSQDEWLSRAEPPYFYHNVLHDLESVYWVSLWTMLWFVGDEDKDKDQNNEVNEDRQLLAKMIFSTNTSTGPSGFQRVRFLQDQRYRVNIFREYGRKGIRSTDLQGIVLSHFNEMPLGLASQFTEFQANLMDSGELSHDRPVFKRAFDAMETSLKNLRDKQKTLESKVEPIYIFRVTLDKEDEPQKLDKPVFYPGQSEEDELDEGPDGLNDTIGLSDSKRPKLDSAGQPLVEDGTGLSV